MILLLYYYLLLSLSNVKAGGSPSSSFVQRGSVGGGNYSHFIINEPETFILKLYSFKGDADLYVSESVRYPSFDLEEHTFQSVTCGLDSLTLQSSVPRPIFVAVYGHPAHSLTNYVLELSLKDPREEPLQEDHLTWVLNNLIYFTKEEQNEFTPHQVDKYYPEWSKDNVLKHYSAENERLAAELILEETKALINETKAKQKQNEKELTSRFKTRVGDIKFWQSELDLKLAKLRDELEELECQRARVAKNTESTNEPIAVMEKCLAHRGKRQGPDLVEDNVQKHLNLELETFKNTKVCGWNFVHIWG